MFHIPYEIYPPFNVILVQHDKILKQFEDGVTQDARGFAVNGPLYLKSAARFSAHDTCLSCNLGLLAWLQMSKDQDAQWA